MVERVELEDVTRVNNIDGVNCDFRSDLEVRFPFYTQGWYLCWYWPRQLQGEQAAARAAYKRFSDTCQLQYKSYSDVRRELSGSVMSQFSLSLSLSLSLLSLSLSFFLSFSLAKVNLQNISNILCLRIIKSQVNFRIFFSITYISTDSQLDSSNQFTICTKIQDT
jgi:hypothetical protein